MFFESYFLILEIVSPRILDIVPRHVPIDNEDYQITVSGQNFHPKDFRYICMYSLLFSHEQ